MTQALQAILDRSDVWRAGRGLTNVAMPSCQSGYESLDQALSFGGWPLTALTELLTSSPGQGEMQLLLPALARVSQKQWVVMIAPPYIPYAPALIQAGVNLSHLLVVHPKNDQDALWAMEQALLSGCCGAVLAWPKRAEMAALRRLQLAAEQGGSIAVLLRSGEHLIKQSSPAALRLAVNTQATWLKLDVVKCRGAVVPLQLDLPLGAEPFNALRQNQTPVSKRRNAVATNSAVSFPTQMALPLSGSKQISRRRRYTRFRQEVA